MTSGSTAAALREIGTLFASGTVAGMTDGQLLERFLGGRDEGAEVAFAALVARHGPMVLGVCRRALADPGDAEDAFQATFLILVRRAHSVRVDDSLGRWLYGVSRKVAARARTFAARRPRHESAAFDAIEARSPDPDRFDVRSTIDEELARLPESYRSAIVLCDLGGLTHEEAARDLRCPVGTIKSRLSRGPGPAPVEPGGAGGLAPSMKMAAPMVPARLAEAVVRASTVSAVGGASAAGTVPASAVALAEGMLRTMTGIKLKLAAAALLSIGVAATGAGVMARQEKGDARAIVPGKAGDPPPPFALFQMNSGDARAIVPGKAGDRDSAEVPPADKALTLPSEIDHRKLAELRKELIRLQKRLEFAQRVARDPKDPAISRASAELREVEAEIARLVERDPDRENSRPTPDDLSRKMEAKLNQLLTLHITEQPLAEVVIPHLQELTGLNIILDPKAMAENGLTRETPVSFTAEKLKLSQALIYLLRPIGLTYRVEDDVLLITTPPRLDEAHNRLRTEFFDELSRARRTLAKAEELARDPRDPAVLQARKRAADLEYAVEEFQRLLSTLSGDPLELERLPGRNRKPWPEGGPKDRPPGEFSKVSMPDYVVEPPDILVVEVLEALDGKPISGERLVRPDGKISLGFYGEVYVAGLTTREIKEKVALHLRDYLDDKKLGLKRTNPTTLKLEDVPPARSDRISVDVDAYNSKVYYVQGDVVTPGRLPVTGNETVLDAINYSGGLKPSAAKTSIRVVRPNPTKPATEQYLPVDLDAIIEKGDTTTNYQILPGDRLVVYRAPEAPRDEAAPARREPPHPRTSRPGSRPSSGSSTRSSRLWNESRCLDVIGVDRGWCPGIIADPSRVSEGTLTRPSATLSRGERDSSASLSLWERAGVRGIGPRSGRTQ